MGIDIQPDFSITIYTQDNDMCPQYSKKRRKRRKRTERIIRSKQTDVTTPWAAYTLHIPTDLCHCPQSHASKHCLYFTQIPQRCTTPCSFVASNTERFVLLHSSSLPAAAIAASTTRGIQVGDMLKECLMLSVLENQSVAQHTKRCALSYCVTGILLPCLHSADVDRRLHFSSFFLSSFFLFNLSILHRSGTENELVLNGLSVRRIEWGYKCLLCTIWFQYTDA